MWILASRFWSKDSQRKRLPPMIEGVRKPALESGLMSKANFDKGIADLYRTAQADGVFCYTFFKASAINKF